MPEISKGFAIPLGVPEEDYRNKVSLGLEKLEAVYMELPGLAKSVFHVDIGLLNPFGGKATLAVRAFKCWCADEEKDAENKVMARLRELAESLGLEFRQAECETCHLMAGHHPAGHGAERPHSDPRPMRKSDSRDPLVGGIAVGNVRNGAAGSLGAIVFDADTGEALALSCAHVIGDEAPLGQPGGRVLVAQPPSVLDKNVFGRWILTRVAKSHDKSRKLDCAVATIDKRGHKATIDEIGKIAKAARPPLPGMAVKKSGAATGVTHGMVSGVGLDDVTIVRHPKHKGLALADAGDSGAVWLQDETAHAVGLLYQVRDLGKPHEEAFAVRINRVEEELRIRVA